MTENIKLNGNNPVFQKPLQEKDLIIFINNQNISDENKEKLIKRLKGIPFGVYTSFKKNWKKYL